MKVWGNKVWLLILEFGKDEHKNEISIFGERRT